MRARRLLPAAASLAALLLGAGAACAAPARNPMIDALLSELQAAPNADVAATLEQRLHDVWQQSGSAAARLLLQHGLLDIAHGAPGEATGDFDAALVLEPDYVEAFNDRAAARMMAGDNTGALQDIAQVLQREPRHFAALELLSHVAENREDWKAALDAWQKALALDPHTADAQKRLDMLRNKAEGEPT